MFMINANFLFETIFSEGYSINSLIDFIILTVFLCSIFTLLCIYSRKKKFLIPFGVMSALSLTFVVLKFNFAAYVSIVVYMLYLLMLANRNMIDSRMFLGKKTNKPKSKKSKTFEVEKLYDHDSLYSVIDETVAYLSKNKIGALMTFERKDRLKDSLKNGTYLNAPVTFELLITIFYPGTRLHDGAVVIKGDTIVSASVYYKPTTTPLTGKYGSRHRAALGISEISDSVTVVVSEETGRISIAYNGELTGYSIDNFPSAFENIMNETDISNE